MLGHGESIWALLLTLFVNLEKVKLDGRFSGGQHFQNVIKKAVAVGSRPRGEIRGPVPFYRLRKVEISNCNQSRWVGARLGESFSPFAQVFTVSSARELHTMDFPGTFRILRPPSDHLSGLGLFFRERRQGPHRKHDCSEKLYVSPHVPSEV